MADYLNPTYEIEPAIETFTGNEFVRPHRPEVEQFCREYDLSDRATPADTQLILCVT